MQSTVPIRTHRGSNEGAQISQCSALVAQAPRDSRQGSPHPPRLRAQPWSYSTKLERQRAPRVGSSSTPNADWRNAWGAVHSVHI